MSIFRKKGNDDNGLIKEVNIGCNQQDRCHMRRRRRHGKSLAAWEAMGKNEIPLCECPAGSLCIVSFNPNKMTKEIGLNPGKTIAVYKNEPADSNMIVCLDTTRYILPKSIAKKIITKAFTDVDSVNEK
ncbi:MAG: ferrous iron transport protein A [Candidatus Cloacimonetes bacterium]|nr:ferrous iron transport protein A [Candidatus Cloacimonadota bacterium]